MSYKAYGLDIQLLRHMAYRSGGVLWNPGLNQVDKVTLNKEGDIKVEEWVILMRDLHRRGLVQKHKSLTGGMYPQKSITVYTLSQAGEELLKELGL